MSIYIWQYNTKYYCCFFFSEYYLAATFLRGSILLVLLSSPLFLSSNLFSLTVTNLGFFQVFILMTTQVCSLGFHLFQYRCNVLELLGPCAFTSTRGTFFFSRCVELSRSETNVSLCQKGETIVKCCLIFILNKFFL